jgi:hypothetical protein
VDGKCVFTVQECLELILKWEKREMKKAFSNFNRENNKHNKSRKENVKEENKNKK